MVIADRDREILRLREEVRRLQLMLQEAQESTANQIAQLEGQLARKIESIEVLGSHSFMSHSTAHFLYSFDKSGLPVCLR